MTTTHRGPAATRPSNPARHSYTTFELAGGLFGAATDTVKEITVVPPLTPVPHAPAAVRGYVNLRGHIVLVVDVNCLLRRGPAALGPDSRLVVFKPALGDAFGILVDRIGDIAELDDQQIESHGAGGVPSGTETGRTPHEHLIHGVGKLNGDLLLILDVRRLAPFLEQAVRLQTKEIST